MSIMWLDFSLVYTGPIVGSTQSRVLEDSSDLHIEMNRLANRYLMKFANVGVSTVHLLLVNLDLLTQLIAQFQPLEKKKKMM